MDKTILYCYNYNFMNSNKTTYGYKAIEVAEREKSFKLLKDDDVDMVDCKKILKKQDLNSIIRGYSTYYLFSDKPNGKLFKTFLEEVFKRELNEYKLKVEKLEKTLKAVEELNICD